MMNQPESIEFNIGENSFPAITNESQEFVRGLIQKYKPQKIVEVGAVQDREFGSLHDVFAGVKENSKFYFIGSDGCGQSPFFERSFSAQLEEIGDEIDLLILNPFRSFPAEILDFLMVFPYLKKDAAVVLCDTFFKYQGSKQQFPSSVLYRVISAKKFDRKSVAVPDLKHQIENSLSMMSYPLYNSRTVRVRSASDVVVGFQLCSDTYRYINDLFVSLTIPWTYFPNTDYLAEYETFLAAHYNKSSLRLFENAKKCARARLDPWVKMLQDFSRSLFSKFGYIVIYGKKERGKNLLGLCQDLGIKIQGFVVSDGRKSQNEFEHMPVYSYSQIPFDTKETLILNTTASLAVKSLLGSSQYHWIDFSATEGLF